MKLMQCTPNIKAMYSRTFFLSFIEVPHIIYNTNIAYHTNIIYKNNISCNSVTLLALNTNTILVLVMLVIFNFI